MSKEQKPESKSDITKGPEMQMIDPNLLRELIQSNKDKEAEVQELRKRMDALGSSVSELKNNGGQELYDPTKPKVTKIKLRRHVNGKIIVEHENIGRKELPRYAYYERTPQGEEVYYINIRFNGENEFKKVKFNDLLSFDTSREEYDVISFRDEEIVEDHDEIVEVSEFSDAVGKRIGTGTMMKAVARGRRRFYTVEVDGKNIEVPEEVLG